MIQQVEAGLLKDQERDNKKILMKALLFLSLF